MAMTTRDGENKPQNPRITKDTLSLAVCSALRRGILICLKEGKKPLRDLRAELGVSSTTAIHALRELEKNNLVFQDEDKDYALTKIGEIITIKLIDFVRAMDVLKKHEDFWLEHDLSGVPPHLLEKIGALSDSTIEEAPVTDLFRVHSTYINMVKQAKELRGVSAIFVPELPLIFRELTLEKKVDVQLVVTKEVLNEMDQGILKEIFSDKNSKLKLYIIKEDLKAAFTVTDYFLSFGLFNPDGTYDWNKDLISYNKEAIAWGRELFEHYVKISEKVLL